MKNTSVLPEQLAQYDDEKLAEARQKVAGLSASRLREKDNPYVVTLPNGRQTTYHFFTPPKGYTDFPAEETLVHFQPIANGMKPQAMALVHALMALTGQNVLFVPQNNYALTRPEKQRMRDDGDFSPLAQQRVKTLEYAAKRGHVALQSLRLAGFSFGATDAAATTQALAKSGAGMVDALVVAEPANVTDRTTKELLHDFNETGTKQFLASVAMSQFPALTELYGLKEDGTGASRYLYKDLAKFPYDFVRHGNFPPALGLRHATLASQVVDGLGAMRPDATLVLHKDLDSSLAPLGDYEFTADAIKEQALSRGVHVVDIRTSTPERAGHAIGDNPWYWATMARIALAQ